MKTTTRKNFPSSATAVVAALAFGCFPQFAAAQTTPAPPPPDSSSSPASQVAAAPNIIPGSPFAEVVRMSQAGVDEGIISAFVANSASTFNLDSEKIIYLSDLGVPKTLITAMMQRDQQLHQQFAAEQAAQAVQQAQSTPPTQTAPAPETAPPDTTVAPPEQAPAPVTVNYFYDSLAPYGSWVTVNGYGQCWRPTVVVYNTGWQPYCDQGHWVYTDCGWYWASSYAWGATFHYGRWFRDASFGWCWYPDTVWAPSWVTWRYSNNYCGWAPLPPRTTYQAGVGIVFNGGNVSVGFNFGLGASCFTFVPAERFCSSHPRNYCAAPSQVTQIYNNTTVINNYNYHNRTIVNHGIAVENIAASTRTTIHPVPVHQVDPAFRHDYKSDRINYSSHDANGNRPARTHDFGSPLRTPQAFSSTPQQSANPAAATVPQHVSLVTGYHSPSTTMHGQSPAAGQDNNSSARATFRQLQPVVTPQQTAVQDSLHPTDVPKSRRDNPVTTISPRGSPTETSHSQTPVVPGRAAATDRYNNIAPPATTSSSQRVVTPRNYGSQGYHQQMNASEPQSRSGNSSASSSPSNQSQHNGNSNQNWQAH